MTTEASANTWIIDDGVIELTPEFTVQHIQGNSYSDVYAAFNHNPQKKLVRLRPGDTISVNGHALQGLTHARGYYYQGRIPITRDTFTYTLARAGLPPLTYALELPELGVREVPQAYRPMEVLRVPVTYAAPPEYVINDSYDLPIYVPERRFTLDSKTRKKDNPYQFDRLPDIQDGAIVFRLIGRVPPPSGVYAASIYRQHHVVLGKLPGGDGRPGWATLTNTLPFKIEVK